jgi:putative FmdB family regulatory protein
VPIYEYRCRKGHEFEVKQSMTDESVTACTECGAPVERVFRPVAVHFKGSGFYTTDYGRKRSGPSEATSGDGAKGDSGEAAAAKSETSDKSEKSESSSGSKSEGSGSGSSSSGD